MVMTQSEEARDGELMGEGGGFSAARTAPFERRTVLPDALREGPARSSGREEGLGSRGQLQAAGLSQEPQGKTSESANGCWLGKGFRSS